MNEWISSDEIAQLYIWGKAAMWQIAEFGFSGTEELNIT